MRYTVHTAQSSSVYSLEGDINFRSCCIAQRVACSASALIPQERHVARQDFKGFLCWKLCQPTLPKNWASESVPLVCPCVHAGGSLAWSQCLKPNTWVRKLLCWNADITMVRTPLGKEMLTLLLKFFLD